MRKYLHWPENVSAVPRRHALPGCCSWRVLFAFWLAFLAFGPRFASAGQIFSRHLPVAVVNLQPLNRLAETNRLDLGITLPLRNQPALTSLLHQLYDPASTNFHRYLSPGQFNDRFAPDEKDYQALIAFARTNGLSIVETHSNRTFLHLEGAVSDIERIFHIKMQVYSHPTANRNFYAPDAAPSVDLPVPLLDVAGLQNYNLPHPAFSARLLANTETNRNVTDAGSGAGGTFMGYDFRDAYAPGVTLQGAGQSLALFEMDGYYTNDISAYESQSGLPDVTLTNVLLGGFDGIPVDPSAVIEVSLDIEMAIAMAPGLSQVMVYEAPLSSVGAYDILNRMATDNQAEQISSSWVIDEIVTNPVPSQIYEQFAAQGQSFFQASGDDGAYFPGIYQSAGNPYITIVGGTSLTTTGPGGDYVSETTWPDSGGGISPDFTIPTYQQGIDMTTNGGSTTMRNVPDIALTAANVEVVADNGLIYAVAGTSCATPLWAGFTALINQQAADNGQLPIGFLNPAIYALGQQSGYTLGLHDITTGNNTSFGTSNLYYAVPGYDLCTGWGTPNGSNLINALVLPADTLAISPGLGFAASGPPAGPFAPSSQAYSLKNAGSSALNWTLVNTSAWLTVSATGGQLVPGGLPVTVTASLNANVASLPAGTYATSLCFTNLNDGFGQSRQFILQVLDSPVIITAQPANQFVGLGDTATFTVGVTGPDPHFYWQKNGLPLTDGGHISGSATSSLTISDTTAADAAIYSVIVSNFTGSVTSAGGALEFYVVGGGQLVQNGGFETGNFAGWTLSGNTNLMAVTTNAFAVHSGNDGAQFGSAGSLGFISQTLPTVPGASYLVSAWVDSPDGSLPNEFTLQWAGNTLVAAANLQAIGWTNVQFIVTATTAGTALTFGFRDDSSYLALDDVSVMAITSTNSPPVLTSQPLGQQLRTGDNATFSVTAIGTAPLTYQWLLNGTNLTNSGNFSGVTSTQLTVPDVTAASAGIYSVVVSNPYGVATSSGANVNVLQPGVEVIGFDDLPDVIGFPIYNGYQNLNWNNFDELSGVEVLNEFGPNGYSAGVISPDNVAFNDAGLSAGISSAGPPFNLLSAYLTAAWDDNLQVQTLGYDRGNNLVFSNICILSATSPTLVLFNFTNVTAVEFIASGGTPHPGYNGSGEFFAMDNLAVSFAGPVQIAQQPVSQSVPFGANAAFSVTAIGSPPFTYQWQKNGADLSAGDNDYGSTNSLLTISNVTTLNAGDYAVIISNAYGSVTSSIVALTAFSLGPNLVQNGGFETGDFTDWTTYTDPAFTFVTTNPAVVHSGLYGAQLAASVDTSEYFIQNVPTVPGATYQLSLWLKSLRQTGANYFSVYWNGNSLADEMDANITGWTNLQFIVTAGGSSSELDFYYVDYSSTNSPQGDFALDDISLDVLTSLAMPPVITNQPIAQDIPLGDAATFNVTAGGNAPLAYQWQWNGTNLTDGNGISGSATSRLMIANASAATLGNYSVVITNAFGAITSAAVPLTLLPAGTGIITFDDLPDSDSGLAITNGYAALNWTNFNVLDGINTMEYQPGAAASVVSGSNVASAFLVATISCNQNTFNVYSAYLTSAFMSPYQIAVVGFQGGTMLYSNNYILSDTAPALINFDYTNITTLAFFPAGGVSAFLMDNLAVSFNGPVSIVTQPVGQTVIAGQTVGFNVSASGSLPLSFQWQKNGMPLTNEANISGAATAGLIDSNVSPADVAQYSVVVSNLYGSATSEVAALTLDLLGTNLVQNGGFETGDFTGWDSSGNTKSTYVTTNALFVHSGNFGAQLGPYGSYGELVQTFPTIPGVSYLVSFSLDSQPQFGYNYFDAYWNGNPGALLFAQNELPVFGWTNLQFTVAANDAGGGLQFNFENDFGYFGLDDVSVNAITNIDSPPVITGQPSSLSLLSGVTATFNVTVVGTAPLNCQWRFNGTNLTDHANLSGSFSTTLTITNISPANAGAYSVVVTNLYGSVTSTGAVLAVLPSGETLITFDDLYNNYYGYSINNGYANLNWSAFDEVNGQESYYYQPESSIGLISSPNVAYAYSASAISATGIAFSLLSAYLTADSSADTNLLALGYVGSTLVYSNNYSLSAAAAALITFNYTNISQVQFILSDDPDYGLFVMDNLLVSTNAIGVPVVTNEPAAQTVLLAGPASFNVGVSGAAPLHYQWQLNGVPLADGAGITGSATSQLTLHSTTAANVGLYSVTVTNLYGSDTSIAVPLSVYFLGTSNLVQNGGFETGDFSGWLQSGDPKNVAVTTNSFFVHSGLFGAEFGSYAETYLDQGIPTTIGKTYQVSFWVDPDGQGDAGAYWGGNFLFDSILPAEGWTNLQFTLTAVTTGTLLQFNFQDLTGYLGLDDVSVVAYNFLSPASTVPFQISSPQVANGGFSFGFLTVLGQSYTIEQCTNLASPAWSISTNFTGTGSVFQFNSPANSSQSQLFFRVRQP